MHLALHGPPPTTRSPAAAPAILKGYTAQITALAALGSGVESLARSLKFVVSLPATRQQAAE